MIRKKNNIALVDEKDQIKGYEEKLLVHEKGLLHRAFSIFIFNSKNEILLQQRAHEKYHSGGLWTNTCCSHLAENEDFDKAIHKRLKKEMGFDCPLDFAFKFHYRVCFKNGLIENEIDHVFIGKYEGVPKPNPAEVATYKWMSINQIKLDLEKHEENYTYWFKVAFEDVCKTWENIRK